MKFLKKFVKKYFKNFEICLKFYRRTKAVFFSIKNVALKLPFRYKTITEGSIKTRLKQKIWI